MPKIHISRNKWNEIVIKTDEDPDKWIKRLIDEKLKKKSDSR